MHLPHNQGLIENMHLPQTQLLTYPNPRRYPELNGPATLTEKYLPGTQDPQRTHKRTRTNRNVYSIEYDLHHMGHNNHSVSFEVSTRALRLEPFLFQSLAGSLWPQGLHLFLGLEG